MNVDSWLFEMENVMIKKRTASLQEIAVLIVNRMTYSNTGSTSSTIAATDSSPPPDRYQYSGSR